MKLSKLQVIQAAIDFGVYGEGRTGLLTCLFHLLSQNYDRKYPFKHEDGGIGVFVKQELFRMATNISSPKKFEEEWLEMIAFIEKVVSRLWLL